MIKMYADVNLENTRASIILRHTQDEQGIMLPAIGHRTGNNINHISAPQRLCGEIRTPET
jgi:hypothetical protein